jgi:hypothetical protein
MRKADKAQIKSLNKLAERWDYYSCPASKRAALRIISDAIIQFNEDGYHDFDSEIADLYAALDDGNRLISEALNRLSPYTLGILRGRPDWDEDVLLYSHRLSNDELRTRLTGFFTLSACRYMPHIDKRWYKRRIRRTRIFRRSGGSPSAYKASLIIFCNSICMAHVAAGRHVPHSAHEIIKKENFDLLNLIADCFEVLLPNWEIEPEKILAATLRWRAKYQKKYGKASARVRKVSKP